MSLRQINRPPRYWSTNAIIPPLVYGDYGHVGRIISTYGKSRNIHTGPHTCLAVNVTQDHNNLDAKYMAHALNKIVSKAPSTKIRALQEIMKKFTGGYMPSYAKAWAAKQIVIKRIHGDWDQSLVSLPTFLQVLHFVTDRQGLCLISDRHPDLLAYLSDEDAYDWRPPFAHHRFCLRHLAVNYHRRFGSMVGKEVKITAMESQKRKFKDKLSQ
ncbi:hypothetical protein Vadar_031785 [Vaccinium darrowii]|uniref:Uncharacterized protein n=1 Tax=Vaccinium darrowii TaxID=229202 RepID=A0ACB7X5X4_9ERIC|nr:hypothetical protein Vadar_031785 [Vaccinium darrowii]